MCDTTERAELLLPANDTAPAAARAFARENDCTEHAAQVLEAALLLISELVTNSVSYGRPPVLLAVECDGGGGLKVRVRDGSTVLPLQRQARGGDESGRGLTIVDLMSDAWGVEPVQDEHGVGKAVWFELRPTGTA
ncbi:MAG: putative anti-sigma regulatory factor, serine/threonine protein kinase [Frankiales bacterium]|jgi:anti-sigma regulatory factor (Ser/Thr protein kinase)|nr:putative anti-sigma regulatory factor, serine/threonine protein kinase [Frankiales bacterium]